MFLLTLFRIESEIHLNDAIAQEIEKRVVKSFSTFNEASDYINGIKNHVLMDNFPFAMIQAYEEDHDVTITDQTLWVYNEDLKGYALEHNHNMITRSARKKLHQFEKRVHYDF